MVTPKIDVNCFVGHWPFRRCREHTLEDLKNAHRVAGITKGYVSSLQSIFWNDHMEAEAELAELLAGSGYEQVCTVNPALPEVETCIAEAVERFHIKAVRICPGYHGYRLDDPCMEPLRRALIKYALPLYLTVRLEDERLNYIVTPGKPDIQELRNAVTYLKGVRILLVNLKIDELLAMTDLLRDREDLFVETSGFRAPTGWLELALSCTGREKYLFGSSYILYPVQCALAGVEYAAVSEEVKEQILFRNAQDFFRSR